MKPMLLICIVLAAGAVPGRVFAAIDPATVCIKAKTGDGRLYANPIRLLNATLSAGGSYPSGYFDVNNDGSEKLDEKFSALFTPIRCKVGDDVCNGAAQNLDAARNALIDFLREEVEIESLREPSAEEIAARPYLAIDSTAKLAMALDEEQRYLLAVCNSQSVDKPAAVETVDSNRWRITGTIEGLSLPRETDEQLAAVPQATVSYVSDREKRETTFDVDAVGGRAFSLPQDAELIPFLGFRRQVIETRDATIGGPDTKGSSEWNVGVLYSRETDGNSMFDLAALYTAESEHDSRIVSVEAGWKPGVLYRNQWLPFGGARKIGHGWVMLNAQLSLQAGDIIDAGTSTDLAGQDAFARIGPTLQITFWPDALPRLRADATYKHWFRVGDTLDVTWLDTGFNYEIDPEGHYTLRYSYQRGRDEETLERIRRWTLSFGVRF